MNNVNEDCLSSPVLLVCTMLKKILLLLTRAHQNRPMLKKILPLLTLSHQNRINSLGKPNPLHISVPDDLVVEILRYWDESSLFNLCSVCSRWNTLISNHRLLFQHVNFFHYELFHVPWIPFLRRIHMRVRTLRIGRPQRWLHLQTCDIKEMPQLTCLIITGHVDHRIPEWIYSIPHIIITRCRCTFSGMIENRARLLNVKLCNPRSCQMFSRRNRNGRTLSLSTMGDRFWSLFTLSSRTSIRLMSTNSLFAQTDRFNGFKIRASLVNVEMHSFLSTLDMMGIKMIR